ncbi:MAG: YdeI/OmpD-associated family protein, partial [Planctomycetes bacterium]|nr:YdeI/OmpD-associated family protein [Planctomycetota bacterium]
VRFTPRKAGSRWSLVNVRLATELEAAGRMHAAGLAAFRARDPKDARRYSFETRELELSPAFAKKFRAQCDAWAFFRARPPGYRRTASFWVMSAKQQATRERRLDALIDCSARGATLPMLTPRKRPRNA